MYRGMNYGKSNVKANGSGKMASTIPKRTKQEIQDSLELFSIRDLERLAVKSPIQSEKAVKMLVKKYKKNETHLAAKNSLMNLCLSKNSTLANVVKECLIELEEAWSNKTVNIHGRNIANLSEFRDIKVGTVLVTPKNPKKSSKNKKNR